MTKCFEPDSIDLIKPLAVDEPDDDKDGDLSISPDSIKDYVEMLSTSDLVIASKRHPNPAS